MSNQWAGVQQKKKKKKSFFFFTEDGLGKKQTRECLWHTKHNY